MLRGCGDQGFGTFFNAKGEFYQGEWLAGKRNGKGRQTYGGRAGACISFSFHFLFFSPSLDLGWVVSLRTTSHRRDEFGLVCSPTASVATFTRATG